MLRAHRRELLMTRLCWDVFASIRSKSDRAGYSKSPPVAHADYVIADRRVDGKPTRNNRCHLEF